MELGLLLTRSSLTCPEVFSKVCHDSFYQLGNSVSLPWVIYYGAFYLHSIYTLFDSKCYENEEFLKFCNLITILHSAVTIFHLSVSYTSSRHQYTQQFCVLPWPTMETYGIKHGEPIVWITLFCLFPKPDRYVFNFPIIRVTLGISRFYHILYMYSKINQVLAGRKMLTQLWPKFLRLKFPPQRHKTLTESRNIGLS